MSHSLQPNAKVVFQNSDVKFIAEKDVKLFVKLSWIVHMDHLLSFRFSVWKNHTPNHSYTAGNDNMVAGTLTATMMLWQG